MELIPILSTIILLATVCTIILVVCAFVLYKIYGKKSDLFVSRKPESEKTAVIKPEDFGGKKLQIKNPEKSLEYTKHYNPIGESISNQQKFDKTYQENERKKIKRNPTEPKYLKFTSDGYVQTNEDRSSGNISWR